MFASTKRVVSTQRSGRPPLGWRRQTNLGNTLIRCASEYQAAAEVLVLTLWHRDTACSTSARLKSFERAVALSEPRFDLVGGFTLNF